MLEDSTLHELFLVLKDKKIKGIRKDNEFQITLKFTDNTEITICGGATDYGEVDVLDFTFKYPYSTDKLIIGEFD